jgi:peptide/nickel transport system substrate-binding protein
MRIEPIGRRTILAVLLVVGAAMPLGACSGDGGDDDRENAITVGYFTQPDSLDPALGLTIPASAVLNQVYLPLLTYKRVEGPGGTELIPGLAAALPHISSEGTTYSIRLRGGLEYSDGTPVKASDFEHGLKRVLRLGSPGAPLYERIVGAGDYEEQSDSDADIAGIDTDDGSGRIVIRLEQPYAAFEHLLALPMATPVPGKTPFRNMTEEPPPATGPFEFTASEPNRQFVLERNPRFESNGIEGVPPARLDRITVRINADKAKLAEDVLSGKLDYMSDSPPPDLLPTVRERAGDRYEQHPTENTNWFFMNARLPPFDDPRVRQAVNYGVDRRAIGRLFAGQLDVGCSFLPPRMAGYEEDLDKRGCPYGDPTEPPDLERARTLVRAAGAEGAKVTVWGYDQWPSREVTQAYAEMLNQIGLKAEPKLVGFAVWRPTIGNAKNRPQTGYDGWPQAFPHPLTFFALIESDAIRPTSNKNTSNVDDPVIDRSVQRLERQFDLQAATDDWARLNRYVVEKAYLVPYGHRVRGTFVSERIDFKNCTFFHQVYLEDWSRFCLKEGGG